MKIRKELIKRKKWGNFKYCYMGWYRDHIIRNRYLQKEEKKIEEPERMKELK